VWDRRTGSIGRRGRMRRDAADAAATSASRADGARAALEMETRPSEPILREVTP
jgi:hypothetical protein